MEMVLGDHQGAPREACAPTQLMAATILIPHDRRPGSRSWPPAAPPVGLAPALSRGLPARRAGGPGRALHPAGVAAADRPEPVGRHLPARPGQDPGAPHRDAGRHGVAQPGAAALPRAHRGSRKGPALRRGRGVAGHPLGAAVLLADPGPPREPGPASRDPGRSRALLPADPAEPPAALLAAQPALRRAGRPLVRRHPPQGPRHARPLGPLERLQPFPVARGAPPAGAVRETCPECSRGAPAARPPRQPAAAGGAPLRPLGGRHAGLPAPAGMPASIRRPAGAPPSRRGAEFRSSPERPTFVSNEFYFRFDFARPGGPDLLLRPLPGPRRPGARRHDHRARCAIPASACGGSPAPTSRSTSTGRRSPAASIRR